MLFLFIIIGLFENDTKFVVIISCSWNTMTPTDIQKCMYALLLQGDAEGDVADELVWLV